MKIIKTDVYSITVISSITASQLEELLKLRGYKVTVFAQDDSQLTIQCENYQIREITNYLKTV